MIRQTITIVLLWGLTSCGGSGGVGPRPGGAGISFLGALYVDPVKGIDSSDRGLDEERPLRTITFALGTPGRRVIVLSDGVYSASSGESLPVRIPAGVIVVGRDFMRNESSIPLVQGCGAVSSTSLRAAVLLDDGGSFQFAGATCAGGIGIVASGTSHDFFINNAVFASSTIGVLIQGNGTISASAAMDNTLDGIYLQEGSASSLFDNVVLRNGVGLLMERGARATFINRAGTTGMAAQRNVECDVRLLGDTEVMLYGTVWDDPDTEFSVSPQCAGGANVTVEGLGSVVFGATASATIQAFEVPGFIDLVSPTNSVLSSTTTPDLEWSPQGSKLSAVAIFSKLPVVGAAGIQNTEDIVWFWNSGLGGGASGRLTYARGRLPVTGDLNNLSAASPLLAGRTYYWISWEWNEADGRVVASSPIGVFRTRP